MNELQIFKNSEFGEVRTLEEESGKVLFCGTDVAKILGYSNPRDALNRHCKGVVKHDMGVQTGTKADGTPAMQTIAISFIPEGDVYRLITHSKLPSAEKFESWVFDEVLPTIRKHGAYMTPETLQAAIMNPDIMIQLCQQLKAEQDKNKVLQAENSQLVVNTQIMQPKADYFDELVERNTLTNFRETAQQLGIGQKDFINFLLDKKYVYRDKRGNLKAYADKGDGLFQVKECFNEKTKWSGTQTLITPKGRETFRLLYLQSKH